MPELTKLELEALRAILAETPELESGLSRQLERATVVDRRNTGCGFLTTLDVHMEVPAVPCPRVLGHDTHARIEGLSYGLGFVLFTTDGRLDLLEGYAFGPDETTFLNLEDIAFEIHEAPPGI